MTYHEVNPSMWTYEKEGDFIEGVYVAVKEDVGPNESRLYTLDTNKGLVNVWGSAILDEKMSLIEIGSKIKVTYKGLGSQKSGKHPPKIFKVEVDVPEEENQGEDNDED